MTARAIEGEHELSVHRLAQRMPGCRRLELADHVGVTPRGEIRLDPVLDARESKLLEVRSLDERERLGELCQRGAAPQGEGVAEERRRRDGVARCERRTAVRSQAREARDVDGLGREPRR